MTSSDKAPLISWRGSATRVDDEADATKGPAALNKGRILLLMSSGANRDTLSRHLRDHYELVQSEGEQAFEEAFDLIVTDITAYWQWQHQLTASKAREEPAFLPVMLIVSQRDLGRKRSSSWSLIDEFVVSPVDRSEFTQRVEMLLRARRLALAQRSQLAYLVNHDRSTGLPNGNLFMDRLANSVRDSAILDKQLYVAVMHLPLTRVLKSLGHQSLERAALTWSLQLRSELGQSVSLARLTTEEWGILPSAGTSLDGMLEICRKIHGLAREPIAVQGERVLLRPRIGIGVYPDDGSGASAVLDCAMAALTHAKDDQPAFFARRVQHQALRYIRTEASLRTALEEDQFELWFQPQIRLSDHKVEGVEALLRWRLPSGDLVPPGDFLGVAESAGLISDIDRWALQEACITMRRWRAANSGISRIAVNISAEDLKPSDFARQVKDLLGQYELPASALELELTETSLFEISESNLAKLNELREHGINIAIDDFGTGYSSLTYLHRLPVNIMKIDKAFVDNVTTNTTNSAITRAIVQLARSFGLVIVAEGIETREQARYLTELEVHIGQGFLYGRPMPEQELLRWMQDRSA